MLKVNNKKGKLRWKNIWMQTNGMLWILKIIRSLSILSNYFLDLSSRGLKTPFLLFTLLIFAKTECY